MTIEKPKLSHFEKLFSIAFIRVMFRPVLGYKQEVPEDAEYVQITGIDDSSLEVVLFHPVTTTSRGVILLCHPFIKYGMHYFLRNSLYKDLLTMGYRVVLFNFKGFGRSTVKGHAFSDDVVSVAEFAKNRYPDLSIFLIGFSFGGYHASHVLPYHSDLFSAIVLDSVPVTVRRYFKKGILAKAMRWISGSWLAEATGTCSIERSISKTKDVPLHFFYGVNDCLIPQEDINQMKSLCPELQLKSFDSCRHLEIVKRKRDEYLRSIEQALTISSQPNSRLQSASELEAKFDVGHD